MTHLLCSILRTSAGLLLACCSGTLVANAATETSPTVIQVGHWVEVVGRLVGDTHFVAKEIRIVQPDKHETLFGRVAEKQDEDTLYLLGQSVRLSEKTTFNNVLEILPGHRIKVTGRYRGPKKFSAREVTYRHSGEDRIVGRVDERVETTTGAEHLTVMSYTVELPADAVVSHVVPLEEIELSQPRPRTTRKPKVDEDDLFGEGFRLGARSRLSLQAESRVTDESNLNLDEEDQEDRLENLNRLRARLEFKPRDGLFSVLELKARHRIRDEDEDGRSKDTETELGEAFVYLDEIFGGPVDLHIGRQDFDDEREWLYDKNLDGVRGIIDGEYARFEVSLTTAVNDDRARESEATNLMMYLSNTEDDRHLAAYLIRRDIDLATPETVSYFGLRALGEIAPRNNSWLDVAWMRSDRGDLRAQGWGFDVGSTWMPRETGFNVTLGYALGQGGDVDNDVDPLFRQTGWQDNNGKLAGVTSFRYYGELLDPELSNLRIFTAGLGYLSRRKRFSFDLVGHQYVQDHPRAELIEAALDEDPNGVDPDIGWELDAVFGWRSRKHWDLELVAGYFRPGAAFDGADDALLVKLQTRFRH